MLLWLASYLSTFEPGFSVFQYLTLRSILGVLTALITALFVGPWVIRSLETRQIGQSVRRDGPESHFSKQGTPTMGGVLILVCITASTVLWADLHNVYVWIALLVMLGFGVIGWIDDWKKVVLKNSKGLSAKAKYLGQSMVGLVAALVLYQIAKTPAETTLLVPFFKDLLIPLGFGYVILTYFVIVGTSNAVNLTDGLDGLAILPTVLVAGALGAFAYLTGNAIFSQQQQRLNDRNAQSNRSSDSLQAMLTAKTTDSQIMQRNALFRHESTFKPVFRTYPVHNFASLNQLFSNSKPRENMSTRAAGHNANWLFHDPPPGRLSALIRAMTPRLTAVMTNELPS